MRAAQLQMLLTGMFDMARAKYIGIRGEGASFTRSRAAEALQQLLELIASKVESAYFDRGDAHAVAPDIAK